MARTPGLSVNRNAFLDMIAASEIGTQLLAITDDGYNCLVGSTIVHPIIFESYYDHPHVLNRKFDSTAAGRYQIIVGTWHSLVRQLGLSDFSPLSQDAACLELLRQKGALPFVDSGDLPEAIAACGNEWASFPDANDEQHEQSFEFLQLAYIDAGGIINPIDSPVKQA